MIRAAVILVALASCARDRGVYVAAPADPIEAATGELLHLELADNPEGARRVDCGDPVDCIAKLRGHAVDVAVIERDLLGWLAPAGELVIAAELPIERSFTLAVISDLPAGEARPRIAASREFASRPRGGVADLGLGAPRVQIVDDPAARAAALTGGAVDGAVFESWRLPPGARAAATVRGGRFVVVTRPDVMRRERDRDAVGRAAGAVSVRLEQLGDRIRAAIAAGVDPVEAVRTLAPRDRSPPEPLRIRSESGHRDWVARVERALAARTVLPAGKGEAQLVVRAAGAAASDGLERVVAFDDGARPAVELWSAVGLLDRDEVRRVLDSSPYARLPAGDGPSAWRRLTASTPRTARGAGRGLDTLLNVAVAIFVLWILALIVRAREHATDAVAGGDEEE